MQQQRGFEVISRYRDQQIQLPQRKTEFSAGYDLEAAEDVWIEPGKVALIATGLKAYMGQDEFLAVTIRSGMALKHQLSLINSQGIIDADYYNNEDNEGHIMLAVINFGSTVYHVERGTRMAQGIFYKYLTTDHDVLGRKRTGGYGSTD